MGPNTGERSDEVYIFDLGSTSGTYVNGMALQPSAYYPLYPSDIIQFGQYQCSYVLRSGNEPDLIPPIFNPELPPEKPTQITSAVPFTSRVSTEKTAVKTTDNDATKVPRRAAPQRNRAATTQASISSPPKKKDSTADALMLTPMEDYSDELGPINAPKKEELKSTNTVAQKNHKARNSSNF